MVGRNGTLEFLLSILRAFIHLPGSVHGAARYLSAVDSQSKTFQIVVSLCFDGYSELVIGVIQSKVT
jgi:hypothetical protein